MSSVDEDDKPTVVLDLNALKLKQKQQEDDLASMVSGLEFNASTNGDESDHFVDEFLDKRADTPSKLNFPIILFDFQSDFFKNSQSLLPEGYNYKIVSTLPELNQCLKYKEFQLVIFNFDVNPKAINQLTAQIKQKMPHTKTMIMAKAISPEKAKLHASTPSGASGYFQFPLNAEKLEKEILKIHSKN